jgi:hypothetical protein
MTTKVFRGQLLVFTSTPKDDDGNPVSPSSIQLYLNYPHSDGTTSTDEPIEMQVQTDGTWKADFDTADTKPGAAFASLRAFNPPGAEDIKFTIVANPANPP